MCTLVVLGGLAAFGFVVHVGWTSSPYIGPVVSCTLLVLLRPPLLLLLLSRCPPPHTSLIVAAAIAVVMTTMLPMIAWFNTYETRSPFIWISSTFSLVLHISMHTVLWIYFDGAVTIATVEDTVRDPVNLGS